MNESGGGPAEAAVSGSDTPGGMLRAERERRGYSVQYAAEDLHLDVWVIEALEANRFAALGAPVYAKGHLRRYAMLLGLAPATVLERYEALSGTPLEPTPRLDGWFYFLIADSGRNRRAGSAASQHAEAAVVDRGRDCSGGVCCVAGLRVLADAAAFGCCVDERTAGRDAAAADAE